MKEKSTNNYGVCDIKQEIINYGEESLQMEEKKETTIFEQSGSNLTTLSILIVGLFTVLFELINRLPEMSSLIIIFGITLSCILLLGILFSVRAQWRYKRIYRRTPKQFLKHINEHIKEYNRKEAFLDQQICDIDDIQERMIEINDKRNKNLTISSILIYMFLALVLIFGTIIIIII